MRCAYCGTVYYHDQSHGKDKGKGDRYCSRLCYVSDFGQIVGVGPEDIERAGRMGLTQREASERLRVSYPHFRRLVAKSGLRDMFPANGAASWAAGDR